MEVQATGRRWRVIARYVHNNIRRVQGKNLERAVSTTQSDGEDVVDVFVDTVIGAGDNEEWDHCQLPRNDYSLRVCQAVYPSFRVC